MKAVMFDLDGTILASKEGIFRSAAYALSKLGLPMPLEEDMMAFLGPPLSQGFATVCHVPAERVEDAVKWYREYYNGGGKFEAYIFEGMRECLQTLRGAGIRTYITTSKPHVFAKEIMAHFDMTSLFDGIYGSEFDGTRGRKSEVVEYCMMQNGLTKDDTVLVGDRHFDVDGARKCSVDCIGVAFGYGGKSELVNAGARYVVESASELTELLMEM